MGTVRQTVMIALAAVALLGGAGTVGAKAAQPDVVTRYEQALNRACEFGTAPGPSAYRLYQRAHRVEPWLLSPAQAFDECIQAP